MCYASPVMLRGRCSYAISDLPTSSSSPPLFSNSDSTSPFSSRQLCALCGQLFLFAFSLATRLPAAASAEEGHSPLSSTLSPATLPLSTLAQSPLPTPLQSTHAHLSHSRPPITPAVPTHANLVFPNSFPCNTCEKNSCGRRADIFGVPPQKRSTEPVASGNRKPKLNL